jgi:hypothetical protein
LSRNISRLQPNVFQAILRKMPGQANLVHDTNKTSPMCKNCELVTSEERTRPVVRSGEEGGRISFFFSKEMGSIHGPSYDFVLDPTTI